MNPYIYSLPAEITSAAVPLPFWNDHSAPYNQRVNQSASFTQSSDPKYLAQVTGLRGLPFWNDHRSPFDQRLNRTASFTWQSDPKYLAQVNGLIGLPFSNDHRAPFAQRLNQSASFIWQSDPKYAPVIASLPFWNDHRAPFDQRRDVSGAKQGPTSPIILDALGPLGLPFRTDHRAPYSRRQDAIAPLQGPVSPIRLGEVSGLPFKTDHRAPYSTIANNVAGSTGTAPIILDQVNLPFWNAHWAPYDRRINPYSSFVYGDAKYISSVAVALPFRTDHSAVYSRYADAGRLYFDGRGITARFFSPLSGTALFPLKVSKQSRILEALKPARLLRVARPARILRVVRGMPRNTQDFSPADPATFEQDPIGFDFTAVLAIGETIASAVWTINVVFGTDPTPSVRLLGSPSIQGNVVSQTFGGYIASTVYNHTATITTSLGNIYSQNAHHPCDPIV